MRKSFVIGILCLMAVGATTALFANGRNMNVNMSAEWCKTVNRHASMDEDASYFNPAGTALMADGFYMYMQYAAIYQPVEMNVRGGDTSVVAGVGRGKYEGTKAAWYFLSGGMALKKGRFSVAGAMNPLGGGGVVKFKNGLQMLDAGLNVNPLIGQGGVVNGAFHRLGLATPIGHGPVFSKFWASSAIYNIQLCLSYEIIKEKLAISVGGRLLIGNTDIDINLLTTGAGANYYGTIPMGSDYHAYQLGFAGGAIVGLCAKPVEDLTIAVNASWNSPLNLKVKSFQSLVLGLQDSSLKDNGSAANQLPATIHFGIAYRVAGLQIMPTFAYQFNQFMQLKGKEKGWGGGYDVGIGFDYTFKDVPLNIGFGYLYTVSGCRPSARSQTDEAMDNHAVGLGFTIALTKHMKLTIAENYTYYVPVNVNEGATSMLRFIPVRYTKQSFNTSVGVSTRI